MKHLFLMFCAVIFCTYLNAQINVTHVAPGTYSYNSLYQSADLHFYLYGDGYHNFEADNEHEFGLNAYNTTVKAYHSHPYDADQVEEITLNTVPDPISNAQIETYTLPNKVALKRSWSLVNGEDNFFILMFENIESNDPISGCIEFHFKNSDTNIVGASILDDYDNDWVDPDQDLQVSYQQGYTHKYVWSFENLKKNEQRFIYIPADCLADVFDIVETRAIMKVNCDPLTEPWSRDNDGSLPGIGQSPYYTLRSQVRNFPHDPNCIVTEPNCLSRNNELYTVRYKIYFQNDGVDPVQNVNLDFLVRTPFRSIELIEASHTCEMNWQPMLDEFAYSENVTFQFPNIFLEGTGATNPTPDYDDTYGSVTFDICFNLKVFSLLGIQCADSQVDIYFDLEPPVSATNRICRDCQILPDINQTNYIYYECPPLLASTQETGGIGNKLTDVTSFTLSTEAELQIYPNPTNDLLFLNIEDLDENDLIKVMNTAGEVIINQYVRDIKQSLNLSDFPAGVYYISLQNEKTVKTKSFVKL